MSVECVYGHSFRLVVRCLTCDTSIDVHWMHVVDSVVTLIWGVIVIQF